jgi:hypothetical protein
MQRFVVNIKAFFPLQWVSLAGQLSVSLAGLKLTGYCEYGNGLKIICHSQL